MNAPLPTAPLRADLRYVVYALADALDLVGVDDVAHGKRVGAMAAEVARRLVMPPGERSRLFDLGLLHDIGVSSTRTHGRLVSEFDWESAQAHCITGEARLASFSPLAWMACPVRYHHTQWVALPRDLAPLDARRANLIFLVDRVDALAAPYHAAGTLLMNTGVIRGRIAELSGSYFDPELVSAFLAASESEAFWLMQEARGLSSYLGDMLAIAEPCSLDMRTLKPLAEMFSRIVDAKSPFTAEHSLGVARLARWLAERMGMDADRCDKIEIAGLLHDIGKLRVPDEVLEKPGPLDEHERRLMTSHSYETFQILRLIPGFEDIAPWAAYHHEEPGGTGYPFRLAGEALPLEARILRVADIFQAMVQDRPYRRGLDAEAVREFMDGLVAQARVDGAVYRVLAGDFAGAMRVGKVVGFSEG